MSKQLQKLIVTLEAESSRLQSQLDKSNARLQKWENKAAKSVDKVKSYFIGLASIGALAAIGKQVYSTVAAFEKMEASLKTVTGSAANASAAMKKIQDFASTTPFQVTEVTNAFIKLKALGLTPSEEALKSYGNTASALGKSLDQMIEAVADAATGEFERLKEFGIKAKQQGDFVTFTFQGVSTKVKKNAEEIEGYLQGIGNVQFAGAMAQQMDTIGGKSSNLSDSIDKLFIALGDAGLKKAFKETIDLLARMVKGLTDIIDKMDDVSTTLGVISAVIKTIGLAFNQAGNYIASFVETTKAVFDLDFERFERIGEIRKLQEDGYKRELDLIWAKTDATKKLGEIEQANLDAKGAIAAPSDQPLDLSDKQIREFEALQTSLEDKETAEAESWFRRQEILDNALNAKLISDARHKELTESLEQKHAEKLAKIQGKSLSAQAKLWEQGWQGKLRVTGQVLGSLSQLMQSENKKQFEIGKAAAIAQTVINTYQMATESYKALAGIPIVGPALGAAAAASAVLFGMSQVSAIKSQSFGGGGSASAPSIPTTASNPSTGLPEGTPGDVGPGELGKEPQKVINISISGNPTGEQVRELIEMINEEQGKGAVLKATVAA